MPARNGEVTSINPRRFLKRLGAWRLGLVGIFLLAFGSGTYVAMVMPPYQFHDESSHMGYVEHLATGSLPTVNSPIPTGRGNDQLDRRVASEFFGHRTDIYTGHNPPHPYAIAVVPVRAASILDAPAAPLLTLRMMSVLGFAAAAVITAHLARDLAGGDVTMGLTAGTLMAGTVGFIVQVAPAGLDAPALLTTTGTLWGATRLLSQPGPRRAWELGGWVAAASWIRPMSLVFALVAAGLALVLVLFGQRQRPAAVKWFLMAVRVALPAVVTTGWWYVRNLRVYQSPSALSTLLEKHNKDAPEETFWQILTNFEEFSIRWAHLFRGRKVSWPWAPDHIDPMISWATLLVVVLAALAVGRSWWLSRRGTPTLLPLITQGWIVMVLVSAVPWVLTANHRASGGAAHARYLLPAVPMVVISMALLWRWFLRGKVMHAIPALIAAYLALQFSRLSGVPAEVLNPARPGGQRGPFGDQTLVGRPGRLAALVVGTSGALVAVAGAVASVRGAAALKTPSAAPNGAAEGGSSGGRNKT